MEIFLQTTRLLLRRFTTADADLLVGLDGDPAVMRFLTGGRATARETVEQETLPKFLDYSRPGLGAWAAVEKAAGEFAGWFSLRPVGGAPTEAELGYRLRAAVWGRGYATEGAGALIAAGFAEHGLTRITAQTMTVNTASRRVMEKAGLTYVRTFHEVWPDQIDGGELGDVEYEIRNPAYPASRSS